MFSTFFVDDNMTTVMFMDRTQRKLDYHFLLWDFDCQRIPEAEFRALKLLNEGKIPGYDEEERDDEADEALRQEVARVNNTTTCCSLF